MRASAYWHQSAPCTSYRPILFRAVSKSIHIYKYIFYKCRQKEMRVRERERKEAARNKGPTSKRERKKSIREI